MPPPTPKNSKTTTTLRISRDDALVQLDEPLREGAARMFKDVHLRGEYDCMAIAKATQHLELFSQFDDEIDDAAAALSAVMVAKVVQAGQTVYSSGDAATCGFAILSGSVHITGGGGGGGGGQLVDEREVRAGDSFGTDCLLRPLDNDKAVVVTGGARSHDVVVTEAGILVRLDAFVVETLRRETNERRIRSITTFLAAQRVPAVVAWSRDQQLQLIRNLRFRTFATGAPMLCQGARDENVYIIYSGNASLDRASPTPTPRVNSSKTLSVDVNSTTATAAAHRRDDDAEPAHIMLGVGDMFGDLDVVFHERGMHGNADGGAACNDDDRDAAAAIVAQARAAVDANDDEDDGSGAAVFPVTGEEVTCATLGVAGATVVAASDVRVLYMCKSLFLQTLCSDAKTARLSIVRRNPVRLALIDNWLDLSTQQRRLRHTTVQPILQQCMSRMDTRGRQFMTSAKSYATAQMLSYHRHVSDEVIFQKHSPATHFYVVMSGRVQLYDVDERRVDLRRIELRVVGTGEAFGGDQLHLPDACNARHHVGARVISDSCELLLLSKRHFKATFGTVLAEYMRLTFVFLANLSLFSGLYTDEVKMAEEQNALNATAIRTKRRGSVMAESVYVHDSDDTSILSRSSSVGDVTDPLKSRSSSLLPGDATGDTNGTISRDDDVDNGGNGGSDVTDEGSDTSDAGDDKKDDGTDDDVIDTDDHELALSDTDGGDDLCRTFSYDVGLSALCKYFSSTTYVRAGTILVQQAEPVDMLYIVRRGSVVVQKEVHYTSASAKTTSLKPLELSVLGVGDYFNALCVLSQPAASTPGATPLSAVDAASASPVTVKTKTANTEVLSISRARLLSGIVPRRVLSRIRRHAKARKQWRDERTETMLSRLDAIAGDGTRGNNAGGEVRETGITASEHPKKLRVNRRAVKIIDKRRERALALQQQAIALHLKRAADFYATADKPPAEYAKHRSRSRYPVKPLRWPLQMRSKIAAARHRKIATKSDVPDTNDVTGNSDDLKASQGTFADSSPAHEEIELTGDARKELLMTLMVANDTSKLNDRLSRHRAQMRTEQERREMFQSEVQAQLFRNLHSAEGNKFVQMSHALVKAKYLHSHVRAAHDREDELKITNPKTKEEAEAIAAKVAAAASDAMATAQASASARSTVTQTTSSPSLENSNDEGKMTAMDRLVSISKMHGAALPSHLQHASGSRMSRNRRTSTMLSQSSSRRSSVMLGSSSNSSSRRESIVMQLSNRAASRRESTASKGSLGRGSVSLPSRGPSVSSSRRTSIISPPFSPRRSAPRSSSTSSSSPRRALVLSPSHSRSSTLSSALSSSSSSSSLSSGGGSKILTRLTDAVHRVMQQKCLGNVLEDIDNAANAKSLAEAAAADAEANPLVDLPSERAVHHFSRRGGQKSTITKKLVYSAIHRKGDQNSLTQSLISVADKSEAKPPVDEEAVAPVSVVTGGGANVTQLIADAWRPRQLGQLHKDNDQDTSHRLSLPVAPLQLNAKQITRLVSPRGRADRLRASEEHAGVCKRYRPDFDTHEAFPLHTATFCVNRRPPKLVPLLSNQYAAMSVAPRDDATSEPLLPSSLDAGNDGANEISPALLYSRHICGHGMTAMPIAPGDKQQSNLASLQSSVDIKTAQRPMSGRSHRRARVAGTETIHQRPSTSHRRVIFGSAGMTLSNSLSVAAVENLTSSGKEETRGDASDAAMVRDKALSEYIAEQAIIEKELAKLPEGHGDRDMYQLYQAHIRHNIERQNGGRIPDQRFFNVNRALARARDSVHHNVITPALTRCLGTTLREDNFEVREKYSLFDSVHAHVRQPVKATSTAVNGVVSSAGANIDKADSSKPAVESAVFAAQFHRPLPGMIHVLTKRANWQDFDINYQRQEPAAVRKRLQLRDEMRNLFRMRLVQNIADDDERAAEGDVGSDALGFYDDTFIEAARSATDKGEGGVLIASSANAVGDVATENDDEKGLSGGAPQIRQAAAKETVFSRVRHEESTALRQRARKMTMKHQQQREQALALKQQDPVANGETSSSPRASETAVDNNAETSAKADFLHEHRKYCHIVLKKCVEDEVEDDAPYLLKSAFQAPSKYQYASYAEGVVRSAVDQS
jgi:CRP-like cAMP-binding protein